MTNIVLLNRGRQYCIFNTEDFSLFKINEFSYKLLNHFIKYQNIAQTASKFNISENELITTLSVIGFNAHIHSQRDNNIIKHNRKIERITLHISNDCNLRCKYCYANGGSYGKVRNMMTPSTALQFVDYCCKNFDTIENIVFFGGEPFLNCSVIELVCKSFQEKYNHGLLKYMPKFGAITNGTIISDNVFNVIQKYFSFITISADGPKEINDLNRVSQNGKGSFDTIDRFIRQISRFNNLHIGIESTFTYQHIKLGYSREMIRNFFIDRYGISADIIDEISLDEENMGTDNMQKPEDSIWFNSILSTVVNKKSESKCQILHSTFAISTDGQIYPCHMNIGDGIKPVASIWGSINDIDKNLENNTTYSLKNNPTCLNCWAKNLCGGCSRIWFFDKIKNTYSDIPNKNKCTEFKRIAEQALLKICEIRTTPTKWQKLLDSINPQRNFLITP